MSYIRQLNEVLDSPCYSNALKDVLRAFDKRDCVDSMKSAQVLLSLCNLRCIEVENQAARLLARLEVKS